jgi:UDP-galactopyranose mutase
LPDFNVVSNNFFSSLIVKVMSRDQNAGRNHNIRIDNNSFERVEEFKYLGTTLTYQNSIQEDVKSRLKSGNACYYSVQNLLSSRLLSKNLKVIM